MSKSTMAHFSPFGNGTWWLLSMLAGSIEGHGRVSISASKRGLSLSVAGGLLRVHGRNVDELKLAYEAEYARILALAKGKPAASSQ